MSDLPMIPVRPRRYGPKPQPLQWLLRLFDLSGSRRLPSRRTYAPAALASDAAALASDWRAVGEDLRHAIDRAAQEIGEGEDIAHDLE